MEFFMRCLKNLKLCVIVVAVSLLFAETALCAATAESGNVTGGGEKNALQTAAGVLPETSATASAAVDTEDEGEQSPLLVRPRPHIIFGEWLDENPSHSSYGHDLSIIERSVLEGHLGVGPHRGFYNALKLAFQEDERFKESSYLRKPRKEGLYSSIIGESIDAACKIVGISVGAYLINQLPTDVAGRFENPIWVTAVAALGTVGKSAWKLGTDIKELCATRRGFTPTDSEKRIEAEKLALYIALRYLEKESLPSVSDTVSTFTNWLIQKYPKGEAQSLSYVLSYNPEVFDRW
jgi:hypothetical protein